MLFLIEKAKKVHFYSQKIKFKNDIRFQIIKQENKLLI